MGPITVFSLILISSTCVISQSKDGETKIPAKNLRFDFASPDDIPEAFRDAPKAPESDSNRENRRIQYPACQDGSGGLCVELGKCPAGFKAENANINACKATQECCFKVPNDDKSCKSRGGECMAKNKCPASLTEKQETDCKKEESCCILI